MGLVKLLWWTTKFGVKHVVIPIATTALIAAVLDKVADRVAQKDANHQLAANSSSAYPVTA